MTNIEEFKAWGNETFTKNGKRQILAAQVLQLVYNIAEVFAPADSPFPKFPGTVSQADLDENNEIIITHKLGTTAPVLIMFNTLGQPIGKSYYKLTPIDLKSAILKLYGDIPDTDNGYFAFTFYKIIESIPTPVIVTDGDIFLEDFSSFENTEYGVMPTNWNSDSVFDDSHYLSIYNDDKGLVINDNTISPQINLWTDFQVKKNKYYIFEIKVVQGCVYINIGNWRTMVTKGTRTYTFKSQVDGPISMRHFAYVGSYTTQPIVEYITIQPKV